MPLKKETKQMRFFQGRRHPSEWKAKKKKKVGGSLLNLSLKKIKIKF